MVTTAITSRTLEKQRDRSSSTAGPFTPSAMEFVCTPNVSPLPRSRSANQLKIACAIGVTRRVLPGTPTTATRVAAGTSASKSAMTHALTMNTACRTVTPTW
eukprot:2611173-Pleurochrysis_carterae.AAC.4